MNNAGGASADAPRPRASLANGKARKAGGQQEQAVAWLRSCAVATLFMAGQPMLAQSVSAQQIAAQPVAAQPKEAGAAQAAQARPAKTVQALRFIGEQRIPHKHIFQDTVVGGLSGIDYDPGSGKWILASDDRSDYSPARFYSASLDVDRHGFRDVTLVGVTTWRQPDGATIPWRWFGGRSLDVEAIRFDPLGPGLWLASEGDRGRGHEPQVLQASEGGELKATLPLPPMFSAAEDGKGPRNNLAFEGLAFAPDGQSLWVSMEGPLLEDGNVPTPAAGAMARFTQLARDGRVLRQVAWPVSPIPAAPGPGRFADNGVTEILAVSDDRLLVLERAAVQDAAGRFRNYIRLYEADLASATDVSRLPSLGGASFTPAGKRLVVDLDSLRVARLDNIEGMAWGPALDANSRLLVMVSDDNFNASQVTLLLAFEAVLAD